MVMSAISILASGSVPVRLLTQLRGWFETQWGEVDPFEGTHPEVDVPAPIVAVNEQAALVGGLAFGSFVKPNANEIVVWVNMLIVSSDFRGRGIASQLIRSAEDEAKRAELGELFVYTATASLYEKLGWDFVDPGNTSNERVLTKLL